MEYLGRPVGMSNKPDPIPLNTAGFYLRGGGGDLGWREVDL